MSNTAVVGYVDIVWDAPSNVECSPVSGVIWEYET